MKRERVVMIAEIEMGERGRDRWDRHHRHHHRLLHLLAGLEVGEHRQAVGYRQLGRMVLHLSALSLLQ